MERAIKMLDADIEALQTNLEKWEYYKRLRSS